MDYANIETAKKEILQLLEQRRIVEAITKLLALAAGAGNWEITDKINAVEQSYDYMMQYAAGGVADPGRNKIYQEIVAKLYELTDIAVNELISKTSPKLYYATLRIERLRPEKLTTSLEKYRTALCNEQNYMDLPEGERDENELVRLREAKEDAESLIFKKIWVMYPMPSADLNMITATFTDPTVQERLKDLMVSALLMNALEHFNENILAALLDTYADESGNMRLRIKSLCCALMLMYKYHDIIANYAEIKGRVENFADNRQAAADIMMIFMQFIRSRGTERITRKVQTELVPKIMELRPELRRKLQGGDIPDDPEALAENPDWQELLDKSGITKKIMELNQMQVEGSDVFLSSFSRLKSFPFFNNISNWFLPFDTTHSSVCRLFKSSKSPFTAIVNTSSVFCDSDKYSFLLSVAGVPEQQRNMMLGQFDEQNMQLLEMKEAEFANAGQEKENIANKYLQNLYRFFNLFMRKKEFYNPFAASLNMIDVPFVSEILSDTASLKVIAEFYFKQEFYADAFALFSKIEHEEEPTAEIYQKMGFCEESDKHYAEAAALYEKAELLKSGDVWTLKHLASCYRMADNLQHALECYKRIEELQPQNAAIANSIGNCLLESGNAKDALKYYFKVDYVSPQGAKTMRPIAWCSFLEGNFSQSIEYYDKIIALQPTADDFINRSHVLLASGNTKEAVDGYSEAIRLSGNTGNVINTISNDRSYLRTAGVDEILVSIILDKLRYDAEKKK